MRCRDEVHHREIMALHLTQATNEDDNGCGDKFFIFFFTALKNVFLIYFHRSLALVCFGFDGILMPSGYKVGSSQSSYTSRFGYKARAPDPNSGSALIHKNKLSPTKCRIDLIKPFYSFIILRVLFPEATLLERLKFHQTLK